VVKQPITLVNKPIIFVYDTWNPLGAEVPIKVDVIIGFDANQRK